MAKLLLLVAVAAIVYALLRNYQRAITRQQDQTPAAEPRKVAEDMVRCDRCGVHLPRSEGFLSQGRYFCSDDHRKLGPK